MNNGIKTTLTALSLLLLTTQVLATDLNKQPTEYHNILETGIIIGKITGLCPENDHIKVSNRSCVIVSDGQTETAFFIDDKRLRIISEAHSGSTIDSTIYYVKHTFMGDMIMGNSYIPVFLPSPMQPDRALVGNNFELTGVELHASFLDSDSMPYGLSIIQDNTVMTNRAASFAGKIVQVSRHASKAFSVTTDKRCFIRVMEDDGAFSTVETLSEKICQFATDAAKGQQDVRVRYAPNSLMPESVAPPTLLSLSLRNVPENTLPVGHDGHPINALIPSILRPMYSHSRG